MSLAARYFYHFAQNKLHLSVVPEFYFLGGTVFIVYLYRVYWAVPRRQRFLVLPRQTHIVDLHTPNYFWAAKMRFNKGPKLWRTAWWERGVRVYSRLRLGTSFFKKKSLKKFKYMRMAKLIHFYLSGAPPPPFKDNNKRLEVISKSYLEVNS